MYDVASRGQRLLYGNPYSGVSLLLQSLTRLPTILQGMEGGVERVSEPMKVLCRRSENVQPRYRHGESEHHHRQ